MRASPIQSSFSTGEVSPYLKGRSDLDRYKSALEKCENYIATIQGGLTRRPGTKFVSSTKDQSKLSRLISFEYSTTQAYILELGVGYIRFYKDNGQILSGGTPYEISTTYTEDELFDIGITQSADVLYLVHPNHKSAKLIRRGHTNWSLQDIAFEDGPYMDANATVATITPSAATGSVTLTAGPTLTVTNVTNSGGKFLVTTSTAHGYNTGESIWINAVGGTTTANGVWNITVVSTTTFILDNSVFAGVYTAGGTSVHALFAATDVGRQIRIQTGAVWGYGTITAYTSPAVVTFSVAATLTSVAAKNVFRMGAFGGTSGYPSTVTFHEDRLILAGVPGSPQTVFGSCSGDYENFQPTELDSTVKSSNAITFELNSGDVNVIRWCASDEKGLLIGTVGGEWVLKSASTTEALSPTSVTAKKASSYGSSTVLPVQVGKAVIFVQRAGRKLREFTYFYDVDGFKATDLSVLSEHITQSGIVQMAFQKEPQPIVWAVRYDGQLAALTYDRDVDSIKAGWHRHIVGGAADAAGSEAVVESVAVIPAADGSRDEVWMIVQRWVNGAIVRYVEYMTKLFEDTDDQKDAFFVDSGLTYDSPIAITGISLANPIVVTAPAHGLANGNKVRLSDILGTDELNDKIFNVAGVTANTFQLSGVNGTSGYTTYVSDGYVRKLVSTVTGLSHLEGQTVAILGDGAVQPNKVVSGGSITLASAAATVHVGLHRPARGKRLRDEAGAADGTAMGKTRRIHRAAFMLHRSLNLRVGISFDEMDRWIFRNASDAMGSAPPLFTGIFSEILRSDYDFDNQICFEQDQPLPSTILAIMPHIVTQDRA